ncbi:MAG: LicD family protein [Lachnospiraceae bacterium]|nr:LicD family protein [Lachnospiraceae bacterium]
MGRSKANTGMIYTTPGMEYFEAEEREGFFVSSMMKRYWAAQLKVLYEIDRVCRKHGLKWFADCGTLLGAVRHGGYIPWDDDLDICMLRHDWLKFFEVAEEELPEGYRLLNTRLEKEFEPMLGRITNGQAIEYGKEHMKEYFGCPYAVGIDIFPLDGLSDDEEAEEDRRELALNVEMAYAQVNSGQLDTPECRKLLADIERQNHTILHRRGDILWELRLLLEKCYMMYPSENAENIALMTFWIVHHNHKYSRKLFEDAVLLPFEFARIPVPARYNEVLTIEYGNYMSVHKGGGIHDYPLYKAQEEKLWKKYKKNIYRYTITRDKIEDFHREKTRKEKCFEMTEALMQAHKMAESLVLSGNTEPAVQMLEGCQSLAVSLGTHMENKMPGSEGLVHMLEDYCELVYKSSNYWDENSATSLDRAIKDVEEAIDTYFANKKKEVLFLPCRAGWWKSMQPVYEKYRSMPDTEVTVMPLSYLEEDKLTDVKGTVHNDRALFHDGMGLDTVEDYNIEDHYPDVIVTQFPYDEWGSTMDVSKHFYSKNLTSHTDRLVYVPCFKLDPPIDDEDKAGAAIKLLIEQPAVLYADEVLVSSAAMKKLYVDTLTGIADMHDYWDSKVVVFDAPETVDEGKHLVGPELPEEWLCKIKERKILLFGVNGAFLLEHGSKAIDKLKSAMEQIESAAGLVCLFAPGPDIDQIKDINADLWHDYAEFAGSIENKENIIYDFGHNAGKYIRHMSAYYGTAGSLAHKCRNMGKPVMLMSIL